MRNQAWIRGVSLGFIVFLMMLTAQVTNPVGNSRNAIPTFLAPRSANCVPAWNSKWGGDSTEYGHEIALDPAGNIFLGGTKSTGGSTFIAKFDPAGTQLWNISEPAGFAGIAVGAEGNVTLAGRVGDWDLFLARYDQTGLKLWSTTWDTSGEMTIAECVAVDALGNTYAAGANYSDYGTPDFDAFLVKFDTTQAVAWSVTWRHLTRDFFNSITLDGTGAIYVAGTTAVEGSLPLHPLVGKFNQTTGDLLWERVLDSSPPGLEADGTCVHADSSGGVYLSGPGFVVKLDSNGTLLWHRTWGEAHAGCSVATDARGDAFVADWPYLYRFDASGTLLDQCEIGDFFYGEKRHLAMDGAGFIHLAGARGNFDTGAVDAVVYKGEYHSPPSVPYLHPIQPDLAGNRTFQLAWTPVAGATSYRVYYSDYKTLAGMGIQLYPHARLLATTAGPACDVTWPGQFVSIGYFVVVAVNASGVSLASNCQVAGFATLPPGLPEILGTILGISLFISTMVAGIKFGWRRRATRQKDRKTISSKEKGNTIQVIFGDKP